MRDLTNSYPSNVQSVLKILDQNAIGYELRVFSEPARTASQAAALVGCRLGAIVKSLVFQKEDTGELVMVLVSGKNRVDLTILSQILGEKVHPADPADVNSMTGYPVGAVPPTGVTEKGLTVIDVDLMSNEYVWASAGAENILVRLNPVDFNKFLKSRVADIK
jgi:Cys-tRNA(Pro) deacylase